jgi:hypothetical protein
MVCEGCAQSRGKRRHRCLLRLAREAAAGGAEGAALAARGAAAVGARISVWWPLDEAWYDGLVRNRRGDRGVWRQGARAQEGAAGTGALPGDAPPRRARALLSSGRGRCCRAPQTAPAPAPARAVKRAVKPAPTFLPAPLPGGGV